jgi:hypothetical protein
MSFFKQALLITLFMIPAAYAQQTQQVQQSPPQEQQLQQQQPPQQPLQAYADNQPQQHQQQQQNLCTLIPDQVMSSYPEFMYDMDGNQLQGSQAIPFCRSLHPLPIKMKISELHDLAPSGLPTKTYFIVDNQTIDSGKRHADGSPIRVGCGKVIRGKSFPFFALEIGEAAVIGYYDDAVTVVCH